MISCFFIFFTSILFHKHHFDTIMKRNERIFLRRYSTLAEENTAVYQIRIICKETVLFSKGIKTSL